MIIFPVETASVRAENKPMIGTIFFLRLYKCDGLWCFDAPNLGLSAEPFVDGMDVIIDRMHSQMPPGVEKPVLLFSETIFSTGEQLFWMETEDRAGEPWNRYSCPALDLDGWLCPSLLMFFQNPPAILYARLANWPDVNPTIPFWTMGISDGESLAQRP